MKLEIPVKGIHHTFIARQRFKSRRMNKIRRIFRHNHMNIGAKLYKTACKSCDFIGGNTSRHPENDGFSFQHRFHLNPFLIKDRASHNG